MKERRLGAKWFDDDCFSALTRFFSQPVPTCVSVLALCRLHTRAFLCFPFLHSQPPPTCPLTRSLSHSLLLMHTRTHPLTHSVIPAFLCPFTSCPSATAHSPCSTFGPPIAPSCHASLGASATQCPREGGEARGILSHPKSIAVEDVKQTCGSELVFGCRSAQHVPTRPLSMCCTWAECKGVACLAPRVTK